MIQVKSVLFTYALNNDKSNMLYLLKLKKIDTTSVLNVILFPCVNQEGHIIADFFRVSAFLSIFLFAAVISKLQ